MGRRKSYSPEFRADAVRLVDTSGRSLRHIAASLGVSGSTLWAWVREAHAPPQDEPLDADERAELTELRRRVRVLETEREILKEAAAFFAQETDRTR